jgi:hypothetical protein
MNTFIAPVLMLSAVGGVVVEMTSYETLFITALAASLLALAFGIQLDEPRNRPESP